jgi:hypothetical protein
MPHEASQKIEVIPRSLEYDHVIAAEKDVELSAYAYNFGGPADAGTISMIVSSSTCASGDRPEARTTRP